MRIDLGINIFVDIYKLILKVVDSHKFDNSLFSWPILTILIKLEKNKLFLSTKN